MNIDMNLNALEPAARKSCARKLLASDGWLAKFMPRVQRLVLLENLKGEEGQHFADEMCKLWERIKVMPKTYDEGARGVGATVHLHYFLGSANFYITELDVEGYVQQAFGWADLGHGGGELGYISIEELANSGVELDLHWKTKPLKEAIKE